MSTFKIVKVRACVQCGEVLDKTCARCVKHPHRVPRIIQVFERPTEVQNCPHCKISVQIVCAREGCGVKKWRPISRGRKDGKIYSKREFCSKECNAIQRNKESAKRVEAVCSCGCGTRFQRMPCRLSTNAFFRPDHYFAWRAKKVHAEAEERKRAQRDAAREVEDPTTGMLECSTCKKDTIHDTPRRISGTFKFPKAKCQECGTQRRQDLGATMLNRDAMAITMLSRAV